MRAATDGRLALRGNRRRAGLSAGTVGALLARAHGKIRKAVGGRKGRDLAPAAAGEERYAS